MRISGGAFGGMTLKTPKTGDIRPTQDRVREAVFNMVRDEVAGCDFLDLFAGSGAVGLEALSRGAKSATFVERDRRHAAVLKENVAAVERRGVPAGACTVVCADVYRYLASYSGAGFTVAFADPPYALGEERGFADVLRVVAERGVVRPGGLFIAEAPTSLDASAVPGWKLLRDRTYGRTRLCIWMRSSAAAGIAQKRVVLFAGHYGSGKTNIAISYARWLRRGSSDGASRPTVTVADLDIVNPYFRTKDSAETLAAEGIDLVVSEYANTNVDFPALPKEIYALVAGDGRVVMDIGGDDRGALALGRYVDDIRAGGDYEMVGVVNRSRPLTRTPADAVEALREIEAACGLRFTGIVNNTNLGQETTAQDVLDSVPYADEVSRLMGIPVLFTCCDESLLEELSKSFPAFPEQGSVFPLEIQKLYYFWYNTQHGSRQTTASQLSS